MNALFVIGLVVIVSVVLLVVILLGGIGTITKGPNSDEGT